MPIREYYCKTCNYVWEELRKMDAADPTTCSQCNSNGTIVRKLGAPALHFKGSNWSKPEAKPQFNVEFNPTGKTNEEKFRVTERTPSNTKHLEEVHRETSSQTGSTLSAEKATPPTKL